MNEGKSTVPLRLKKRNNNWVPVNHNRVLICYFMHSSQLFSSRINI